MEPAAPSQATHVVQLQENARPKGGELAMARLPASAACGVGAGQAGLLACAGATAPGELTRNFPHIPSQSPSLQLGTAPQLCKLPLGAVAPAKPFSTTGGQRIYFRNTPESTPTAREVLGPVDGSPTAGGLTSSPPFGYATSSGSQSLGLSMGSFHPVGLPASGTLASQHLGFDPRRRKRPADPGIYVDDEFREGHRGTGTSSAAPVASDHSAGSNAIARSSSSAHDAFPGVAVQPPTPSGSLQADAEAMLADVEMDEASPGKENKPPESLSAPSMVPDLASAALSVPASLSVATGSSDAPGGRAEPSATIPGAPLGERFLDVPLEYQEHPYSDIESSDEEFQSENLADRLAERIQQNVDGRYDFDIYMDP